MTKPAETKTIRISPETDANIDKLRDIMTSTDPAGQRPSKHRVVAVAVAEAINWRERQAHAR